MITWILKNREWLFSGVGVVFITASAGAIWKVSREEEKTPVPTINQVSRDDGVIISIGDNAGTINVGEQNDYSLNDEVVTETSEISGVSRQYLWLLISRKKDLNRQAQVYLDTGVTIDLLKGLEVKVEGLKDMLYGLATLRYSASHFEGQTVEDYYDERIRIMTEYNPGSNVSIYSYALENNFAHYPPIIEELILEIVEDILSKDEYEKWKEEWDAIW